MYYTPKIEDFQIGLEYESRGVKSGDDWVWKSEVYDEICNRHDWVGDGIANKTLRVKLLDEEDLQNLGFYKNAGWEYRRSGYALNGIHVNFYREAGKLNPIQVYKHHKLKFDGLIRNKFELKKLFEQIGI